MLRSTCLSILSILALFSASPALAQEEPDGWALSGGFDLIELREGEGPVAFTWDGTFSLGDGTDQVMLMTTGGGALESQIDEVELRLFYGRTIGTVTPLVGVRQNISPGAYATYAAAGVQGAIGDKSSWETYAFLSDQGDLIGEAQVIYQIPITQQFYLEPRVVIGWSAQDIDAEATQAGFTEGEATLRFRYSVNGAINVYAGVVHERLLGGTRRLALEQGEAAQSTLAVVGFGVNF